MSFTSLLTLPKVLWSNPAEALKAIVSGLAVFVTGATAAVTANAGSTAPTAVQWLFSFLAGAVALVATYYAPNAKSKAVKDAALAAEKVAVDLATHNAAKAVSDATAGVDNYWKATYVQGNATPPPVQTVSVNPVSTMSSDVPVPSTPPVIYATPPAPVGITTVNIPSTVVVPPITNG